MEDTTIKRRRMLIILIVVSVIVVAVILSLINPSGGKTEVTDPNKDSLLEPGEGTDFAVIYNSAQLYDAIGQNDDVFRSVGKDMLLFARTTQPALKKPDTLVGFTLDDKFDAGDDAFTFTGRFYGVDDKIELRIKSHGRGVYTLSVTNLVNGANIDSQLSLNGKRNNYIKTLPIEKGVYSIRYQLPLDRIVVSFYQGYSSKDVDEAVTSIKNGLGEAESQDVVYSLNKIGIVTLDQVRQNLINPIPQ